MVRLDMFKLVVLVGVLFGLVFVQLSVVPPGPYQPGVTFNFSEVLG